MQNEPISPSSTTRPYHGLAIYIKHALAISQVSFYRSTQMEAICLTISKNEIKQQLVFLYRMHTANKAEFLRQITSNYNTRDRSFPLTIMGDFNYDISNNRNNTITTHIENSLLLQQIQHEYTTNNTIIDLVFTDYQNASTSTIDSVFSDHKLIYLSLPV